MAARLWWLLRYFGHESVSLLDGGIQQWVQEGHSLSTEIPVVTPASFVVRSKATGVVDKAWVQAHTGDPAVRLLDARARERYEGKTEPVDARAGHIPGAWSAPTTENLRGGGDWRFLTPGELEARFATLGAQEAGAVVAYCGSGVAACQILFALHLAGLPEGLLYEGSWSDWSCDPDLPAATGGAPL